MKKINATISDEADDFLQKYKSDNHFKYKEEAIDAVILELKKIKENDS